MYGWLVWPFFRTWREGRFAGAQTAQPAGGLQPRSPELPGRRRSAGLCPPGLGCPLPDLAEREWKQTSPGAHPSSSGSPDAGSRLSREMRPGAPGEKLALGEKISSASPGRRGRPAPLSRPQPAASAGQVWGSPGARGRGSLALGPPSPAASSPRELGVWAAGPASG